MAVIYVILGIIGSLTAVVLVGALFIKKGYAIERSITIRQPAEKVYEFLRFLGNQEQFSVWVMRDPEKKVTNHGVDGEIGFITAWDGNRESGAGEQEITSLIPNNQVGIEIRFRKPLKAIGQTPFLLEDLTGHETRVTWKMTSSMPYPMNFALVFLNMDTALGKDMKTSLQHLKTLLENE